MDNYCSFLKNVRFFQGLPGEDIDRIASVCHQESVEPEHEIFREGDMGHHFYIVLRGAVAIWKNYHRPDEGLLTVCATGEGFGELALIDDFPRSATAVAKIPTDLLVMSRTDFYGVIRHSARVSLSVMRSLSLLIRERTQDFVEDLKKRDQHLEKAYAQLKKAIEEQRSTERRMRKLSLHDPLTGLPNRASFIDHLQRLLDEPSFDSTHSFAIFCLDLDRFAAVNESLGHLVGDEVLREVSRRLGGYLREGDVLARLGADEFAILTRMPPVERRMEITCQELTRCLAEPFLLQGRELFLSAGISVVPGRPGYASAVDLLRDADMTMDEAKADGPGRWRIFTSDRGRHTQDLLFLETELRRAIRRDELLLMYQPILCLRRFEVAGFETLVRWRHPERGIIGPDVFIPIAERTGLIHELGRWVIKDALTRLRQWGETLTVEQPVFLNINVSAAQLVADGFAGDFHRILEESGVPPHRIKLELTESSLIENVDQLASVLTRIREMGVRFAIDDFGTGYSSLSYLHRLPIDVLKIDKSFTHRMSSTDGKDLVPVIISIAHNLDMEVVAEGVETLDQMRRLREYGCEFGQGFLFSRPLAEADVRYFMSDDERWRQFADMFAPS